ncbi:TIM barrel protein [Lacrimispora sp. NSJ-141]|uniref:TIM barrel protein n=1 Tax=Lientehia hominis TaxID=2897778 RepID=A0AAP2RL92_9FIRM|nr:TIM barrel protein [Lientehia hominis]MCD2493744.1 TIM barrel protein [Lientehia hominis]
MKFAFLTLDFRRFPLEFAFQCAGRYGFDGIEVWGGRPHAYPDDMTKERLDEINSWKKKYHLEIPMFCPDGLNQNKRLTSLNEKERTEAVEYIQKGIDVAEALEAPRILVVPDHPGYGLDPEEVWQAFCDSLVQLADYAEGKGVRITVEPLTPMESPVVTTSDHCVRLLKDVENENVNFMMDVVPPAIAYEPFSEYFKKLGNRMDYIHICNNDGRTDAHMKLDEGVLPIEDMFTVFKNWEYKDYVSAELYSELYWNPEMMLANTVRIINGIRERVGI